MLSTIENDLEYKTNWKDQETVTDDELLSQIPESPAIKIKRKGAGWIKGCISEEKRSRLRTQIAFEVDVCPLDETLEPIGKPQPAMILNYSEEGVCLEHDALIPEQYVSITWSDSHEHQHIAIVRLKWCRSTEDRKILSGGRVCSMETLD